MTYITTLGWCWSHPKVPFVVFARFLFQKRVYLYRRVWTVNALISTFPVTSGKKKFYSPYIMHDGRYLLLLQKMIQVTSWFCCLYYCESQKSVTFHAYFMPIKPKFWILLLTKSYTVAYVQVPGEGCDRQWYFNLLFSEEIKSEKLRIKENKTFSLNTCRYWWVFREQPMRSSVSQFTREFHLFLSHWIQIGFRRLEMWR